MLFTPIAVEDNDDDEYTCTALVAPETDIPMTEDEQARQRAWDALQATPSYCEENARQFAQGGYIHHE
jgi:hypothetical protein